MPNDRNYYAPARPGLAAYPSAVSPPVRLREVIPPQPRQEAPPVLPAQPRQASPAQPRQEAPQQSTLFGRSRHLIVGPSSTVAVAMPACPCAL